MIETTVDVSGLDTTIRDLVRAGRDLRPIFRAIRPRVRDDLKQHFEQRQGPDGAWAPRAASSVARIISRGGLIKRGKRKGQLKKRTARRLANQLGRLKYAWAYQVSADQLVAVNRVLWAIAQHDGDVVGHGSRIPARPFAWASDGLKQAFRSSIVKHFLEAAR